ncbi:MAG: hypothetical protein HOO96_28100 [Polyangiaceae bacterium]|nr:hypothetical protein [Polyangiaceae bacterium]
MSGNAAVRGGVAAADMLALRTIAVALAVAVLWCLSGVWEGEARACGNVVQLEQNEAVRRVVAAQAALDEGDYAFVLERLAGPGGYEEYGSAGLAGRAARIYALAASRSGDRAQQASAVRRLQGSRFSGYGAGFKGGFLSDPTLEADLGEALARTGDVDAARDLLRPLADRDLIGSPYAYAALARLDATDDPARARLATSRCQQMAGSHPEICEGNMPTPSTVSWTLRRLPPAWLFVAFVCALGLVGLGRHLANRRFQAFGMGSPAAKARTVAAVMAMVFAAVVLLDIGSMAPALAAVVLLGVVGVTAYLDRALGLRAVRHGAVAGFSVRPLLPGDDAQLPLFTPWVSGASGGEVLTSVLPGDTAYREGAPLPVARLRKAPRAPVLVMGVFAAFAVIVFFFALLFTVRGET